MGQLACIRAWLKNGMTVPQVADAPYLFAGIQLLHSRLFADPPGRIFSLVRLFDGAEAAGRLLAIEHDGEWFHVGTPQGLAETRKRLAKSSLETSWF